MISSRACRHGRGTETQVTPLTSFDGRVQSLRPRLEERKAQTYLLSAFGKRSSHCLHYKQSVTSARSTGRAAGPVTILKLLFLQAKLADCSVYRYSPYEHPLVEPHSLQR